MKNSEKIVQNMNLLKRIILIKILESEHQLYS